MRGARPTLVSVLVPILNGQAHVAEQLAALSVQTYEGPWELVVIDNGCTDRSLAIVESWRNRLPELLIVDARRRPGLNYARSAGVAAARGDFLTFCDADDVVMPSWLEALAEAAAHSDLVGGGVEVTALNDRLRQAWQPSSPMTDLNGGYKFLPYVSGGNCGVWTEVARELGWDESFAFGGSDIEFAWRAQLAGYRATFQSRAVIRRRYRTRMSAMMRQWFRYAASEPHLFRCFRGAGMPRRSLGETCRSWGWLVRHLSGALRSRETRGNWLRVAASCCGRMWGSVRWHVVYL
jgi:glycosyltransferase involved in cell wall biosynthesis